MNNNIIMVISELEDGRDKIHAKKGKPIKYDLDNNNDLKSISLFKRKFMIKKELCYSKDLSEILLSYGIPEEEKAMVKNIRYEKWRDIKVPSSYSVAQVDKKTGKVEYIDDKQFRKDLIGFVKSGHLITCDKCFKIIDPTDICECN